MMAIPVKDSRWKTAASMPPDHRIEGSLQTIEEDIKNIRFHLKKAEPNRPYDDVMALFNDILSSAKAMSGRINDALPEWKKQTGRV